MIRRFLPWLVLCSVVFMAGVVRSDDADLSAVVKQLNAEKFADRQAATRQLSEMGKAALPALIQAAKNEDREISTRAIEILRKHFQSGDDDLKAAAKHALESLANGDHAAASRRAKDVLEPPAQNPNPFGRFPGGIQIRGGQIQLQIQAGGVQGARRVSVKVVNGVKDIEAEENGRKVKIHDDPNNGIKMEVTEKVNGKEETKKYEAKDADDLKKKHPEAHKIYEQYSKGNGIQINAAQIQIQNIQPPKIQAIPQIPNAKDGLERSKQGIEQAIERFKERAKEQGNEDRFKQIIENLEKQKQRLDEQIKQLTPDKDDAAKPEDKPAEPTPKPERAAEKPAEPAEKTEE